MRGHEKLISLRKNHLVPTIVFINDFDCQETKDWFNPGEKHGQEWPSDHCTISTHKDPISSLDLRFLVGLTVSITGHNKARAVAIFEKVKAAGAKTIGVGVDDWSEIYHA
jgi:hypothetical protein